MSAIGYTQNFPQAFQANPYLSSPTYGGDPGTYGSPYQSPQLSQQNFMMSIYISMMQTQQQLQTGFSQYLGTQKPGYAAPPSGYQKPAAPSYAAPAPSYQAAKPAYTPKPTYTPKPAPAPKPPAKKGGYA